MNNILWRDTSFVWNPTPSLMPHSQEQHGTDIESPGHGSYNRNNKHYHIHMNNGYND